MDFFKQIADAYEKHRQGKLAEKSSRVRLFLGWVPVGAQAEAGVQDPAGGQPVTGRAECPRP